MGAGIDLGSVPEWLGALGAIGAVVVAILLWRKDVAFGRRDQSDRVSIRIDDLADVGVPEVVVSNDSVDRISNLSLTTCRPMGWQRQFERYYRRRYDPNLMTPMPESSFRMHMAADVDTVFPGVEIRMPLPEYGHYHFFRLTVSFTDAHGRRWHKRSVRGQAFEYVGSAAARSDYAKTGHGRHFDNHFKCPPGFQL